MSKSKLVDSRHLYHARYRKCCFCSGSCVFSSVMIMNFFVEMICRTHYKCGASFLMDKFFRYYQNVLSKNMKYSPMCIFKWRVKCAFWRNGLLHTPQMYGLSSGKVSSKNVFLIHFWAKETTYWCGFLNDSINDPFLWTICCTHCM